MPPYIVMQNHIRDEKVSANRYFRYVELSSGVRVFAVGQSIPPNSPAHIPVTTIPREQIKMLCRNSNPK